MRIVVERTSLERVRQTMFNIGSGSRVALMRGINKGVTSAATAASKEIRAELNVKIAEVKKTFSIFRASKTSLKGRFRCKARTLSFHDTDTDTTRLSGRALSRGYAFTIKKGRGRKKFTTAFKITTRSGFTGIFIRLKETGKLKILATSRISDILSNENRIKAVHVKSNAVMVAEMGRQMRLLLR